MKFFTKKSTIQKILLTMILLLLVNFTLTPYYSYADDDGGWSLAGSLAKELMQLVAWFGDVIMGGLNNFMLGADGFGSAMLSTSDPNLKEENKSWIYEKYENTNANADNTITFKKGEINTASFLPGTKYEIPNMLYSPENIFANNIAALDINFLKENKYTSIYKSGDNDFKKDAESKSTSSAFTLKETIASWYKSFRNIAIVGLLSVLVYLGIRILISSTAADKAKYKESITNWVVALCLVFFIHFIMSAVLMVTDKCTELFSTSVNKGYIVRLEGDNLAFKTNLIGLVRFTAQSKDATTTATYTIIYVALVIYTCIFTFMYFKRFLYIAFFTMIAPLVALTYPIDKVGDGKAQAFNIWFKEYTMNVIIQPIHLILYTVFVGSAYELAAKNPIYALVAIAFLIPAEKFIKKMFGLDKAESSSGFGSFAGGALAMSGLKHLSNMGSGGKNGKGKGENGGSGSDAPEKGIFMPPSSTGELNGFGNGEQENGPLDSGNELPVPEGEDESPIIGDNPLEAGNNPPPLGNNEQSIDEQLQKEKENMTVQDYREMGMSPSEWEANRRQEIEQERQQAEQQRQQEELERQRQMQLSQQKRKPGEKPKPIKGYKGRMLKRGAKAVGRQVWRHGGKVVRAGARTAGAVVGGTIGLGAGLTTGDFSKSMQYMGAGALAGNAIGANAQRGAMNLATGAVNGVRTATQTGREVQRSWNEEKYGFDYAREVERQKLNKKARKEFLKDDKEQRKYRDLAAKMDYKGDVKNLMQAAADYKEAGITDEKLIQNSLKAEYKRDGDIKGKSHDKLVEVASFAHENNFGKDHITESKKRDQFDTVIDTVVNGSENDKREAALMYADIFDSRNTYEKVGKFGQTKILERRKEAENQQKNQPKK